MDEGWLPQVAAFRARVFPDNRWGASEAHLRWRFLRGPWGEPPMVLLALRGDEVVGHWAGMSDRLLGARAAWPVTWMVDLVVAPEHRDTMAAAALFRAAAASGRNLLAIGATDAVLPFYPVFRWQRRAIADTFYRVLRPGPAAALAGQHLDGAPARLAPLADRLLPLAQELASRHRVEVEPLPSPGPEVDALCEELRPRLGLHFDRGARWQRWKLDQRPCGRHRVLVLRHRGGRLRGLVVVKLRARPGVARWAELSDLLVDPADGEAFDALIDAGTRAAIAAEVDLVRLRCSLPAHTTRLRPPWWLRRTRTPVDDLFLSAPPEVLAAWERAPWHLTAAASDTVDTGLDEWEGAAPGAPPW